MSASQGNECLPTRFGADPTLKTKPTPQSGSALAITISPSATPPDTILNSVPKFNLGNPNPPAELPPQPH